MEDTKECVDCKETKDISCFPDYKHRSGKLYKKRCCINCNRRKIREYREKNKEKYNSSRREYYKQNKEEFRKKRKEYNKRPEVSKKNKIRCKQYRKDNIEERKKKDKEYYQKNRERIIAQKIEYERRRREEDPMYRLTKNLRRRVTIALQRNYKAGKTLDMLGCSVDEFKDHIQSQFEEGMTWENYGMGDGNWSLDHIKPCDAFDLSQEDEQLKCFHYSNYQPMWWMDNIKKSNTYEEN